MKSVYVNLTAEQVKDTYGLDITESDIKNQFPYEPGTLDSLNEYEGLTITFNPYHAMQYRNENYPCLIWGRKYKGKDAFVFQRKPERIAVGF